MYVWYFMVHHTKSNRTSVSDRNHRYSLIIPSQTVIGNIFAKPLAKGIRKTSNEHGQNRKNSPRLATCSWLWFLNSHPIKQSVTDYFDKRPHCLTGILLYEVSLRTFLWPLWVNIKENVGYCPQIATFFVMFWNWKVNLFF